jgi:peptidoglycan/xylan/chitin deacetylase (PgdA/CDA1 family)
MSQEGGQFMIMRGNHHKFFVITGVLISLLLLNGCGILPGQIASGEDIPAVNPTEEAPAEMTSSENEPPAEVVPEIDILDIRPNELGEVMVIMYHNLSDKNTDYARTPDAFRKDLKRLYDMGFRTVSLRDFATGNIDTPAGYTPVVLTFDDGHISNFKLLEDQSTDPDSVVGILMDFARVYPEFGTHATFFFNGGVPFGQKDSADLKLSFLLENGMDVGNHSFGHDHFKPLTAAEVEASIGKNILALKKRLPETYEIDLLALPYGERPAETERTTLVEGSYEGMAYHNKAILNVGWKPSVSTFDVNFDFASIQRVQSGDGKLQLTDWLDQYELHPEKRFVSDGRADRVVIPERLSEKLDPEKLDGRQLLKYNDAQ